MAILASDILIGVYALLGKPSQQDLPYEDLLLLANDVIRGRTVDMKLSARNHTPQIGAWVTPAARETSSSGFVGGVDNFIPVKVEWRYTSESTVSPLPQPKKATIVNFEQLAGLSYVSDEAFVAFYDNFENIAFSNNTTELALRQYRIIYEDMQDLTINLVKTIDLPGLFITLCKYEVSLLALDQVRILTPEWANERERLRSVCMFQFAIWDERFKKWQMTQFGNKKTSKRAANVTLRYGTYGR